MYYFRTFTLYLTLVCLLLAPLTVNTGCGLIQPKTGSPTAQDTAQTPKDLTVYCGAGLHKPMDLIGRAFEEKTGTKINYNFAGSAQLLGQMELTQEGDIFIPGSLNDMEIVLRKGLTKEYHQAAYHIPVIGVPEGNPANITGLADFAKPGIRLILGDTQANAIGKKGVEIFAKNNLSVEHNVVVRTTTVNEILTHLALNQGDAGLIWEDNGFSTHHIEIIPIPEEQNLIDVVPVCQLSFSKQPELAKTFISFILSKEGQEIFQNSGFKSVD